jgi:hypothetical protein
MLHVLVLLLAAVVAAAADGDSTDPIRAKGANKDKEPRGRLRRPYGNRSRVGRLARKSFVTSCAYGAHVASTPEGLALELSRASVEAQQQDEDQLREKATTVISAASIVVPIAALSVGHGPAAAAIPFGVAAMAYFLCARACGAALFPQDVHAGLLGSELLERAQTSGAELRQMQASAASYLDQGHRHNKSIIEGSAGHVRRAITMLTAEILALVVALIVTISS